MTLHGKNLILTADLAKGEVTSLVLFGKERLWVPTALFRLSLRNAAGEAVVLSSREATAWEATADGARYRFAEGASEVRYTTIGSVIGTHAGPGAVAVAFFKK